MLRNTRHRLDAASVPARLPLACGIACIAQGALCVALRVFPNLFSGWKPPGLITEITFLGGAGILLGGLALCFLQWRPALAPWCGVVLAILGIASPFAMDTPAPSGGGAMCIAITTAMTLFRSSHRLYYVYGALPCSIFMAAFSLAAQFAWLTGIGPAVRTTDLISISPAAAAGYFLLATGWFVQAWREAHPRRSMSVPVIAGLAALLVVLGVWDLDSIDRRRLMRNQTRMVADEFERTVEDTINNLAHSLQRLRNRWPTGCSAAAPNCQKEVLAFLRDYPMLTRMAWAGGRNVKQYYHRGVGTHVIVSSNPASDDARSMYEAVKARAAAIGGTFAVVRTVRGEPELLMVVAAAAEVGTDLLVASVDHEQLLQRPMRFIAAGWTGRISVDNVEITHTPEQTSSRFRERRDTTLLSGQWSVTVEPGGAQAGTWRIPDLALLIGILVVCFVVATAYFWQTANQRMANIRSLNKALEARFEDLATANAALAQTKTRLQNVLDAATAVSIIATDERGIIKIFNTGAEKMLGYRADEMVGLHTPADLHDPVEIQERSRFLTAMLGRPVDGFDVFIEGTRQGLAEECESTYLRKDGTPVQVQLGVTMLRDASGRATGYLSIAKDISAPKALENALRLKNQELAEQTRRAEDANRAKSEFLARMSHEIRTPMNAIMGTAELLLDSGLNDEQREYVRVSRDNAGNLLQLINNILDISKVEARAFSLNLAPFELQEVIQHACEVMAPLVHRKDVELTWRIAPDTPERFVGDAGRITQILLNLIGNAAKFTNHGEIMVSAACHGAGANEDDLELEFAVSDSGPGIPDSKLSVIFEAFQQADSADGRKHGGTGLGLTISRELAEAMGGRMWATSELGVGSVFHWTIRVRPDGGEQTAETQGGALAGCRVLVVDQSASSRQNLAELMEAWGMQADTAGTWTEAIERARLAYRSNATYDVVLLDGEMPEFERAAGVGELADRDCGSPEIILMLTAAQMGLDPARLHGVGIRSRLAKPVAPRKLEQTIRIAIAGSPETAGKPSSASAARSTEPAPGGRILVAEDMEDNVFLMRAFLKNEPYELTFVSDGRSAVDAVQAGQFDLVLMDVQMPGMDGYTATQIIRHWEREQERDAIPIVALTANALTGQDIKSREMGCDGHLSKPVSRADLLRTIRDFVRRPRPEGGGVDDKAVSDAIAKLRPGYLEARRGDLGRLQEALNAGDLATIQAMAHKIKGSGAGYGFPELTHLGKVIEASAKGGDRDAIAAQLTQLAEFLSHASATPQGVA